MSIRRLSLMITIALLGCCFKTSGQERDLRIIALDTSTVARLLQEAESLKLIAPDSAMKLSREALAMSRRLKSNVGITRSLLSISSYFFEKDEYFNSKAILNEAFPYAYHVSKWNNRWLPLVYNNLANVHLKQGFIDSAVHFYYLSLAEIALNGMRDRFLLTIVYSNLGATFAIGQQNDQALYYLRKALLMSSLLRDKNVLAQNMLNIGLTYENIRKGDSAIHYYTHALKLYKQQKHTRRMQDVYRTIGETYQREGEMTKAKAYYDSATFIDEEKASRDAGLQVRYGNVYEALGHYETAIAYFEKALRLMEMQGTFLGKPIAFYSLAYCYRKIGDNDLAYVYQKAYSDLKDSTLDAEKIRTINQLEVKYRTAEQEKKITGNQLLITRQEKALLQKNIWIWGISIGSLLLAALLIVLYRNNRHKQKLQEVAIAHMKQQQQMDQLRMLMEGEENERNRMAQELHDGIGSLIAAARMHLDIFKGKEEPPVYASSYKNGLKLLDEAYRDLRYTAHNLLSAQLLEKGLAAGIQTYCQKITKPEVFKVHFQTVGNIPDLDPQKALSLYRVIQELVQNAAKHGAATEVIVEIGADDYHLTINVEDNGVGWKLTETEDTGMGVKNLRQRIKILNGSMEIDSRPDIGTTIYIVFDLKDVL